MRKHYKIVSLFSGAGGLDYGFHATGKFSIVFANELLYAPSQTYARNFGVELKRISSSKLDLPCILVEDIEKVDFKVVPSDDVDIVIGGPPCQDFSIVRGPSKKRLGIYVKRGRLYAHFIRSLIYFKPKIFVFENVPGLVNVNRGFAYRAIIEDFENLNLRWPEIRESLDIHNNSSNNGLGYELIFSSIVDMINHGLPQMRQRLIIIGVRKDLIGSKDVFWSKASQLKSKLYSKIKANESLFKKYPLTPLEVFEGKALPKLQETYKEIMMDYKDLWADVSTEFALKWKRTIWDRLSFDVINDYLFFNEIKKSDEAELDEAFSEHKKILNELGYLSKPIDSIDFPDGSHNLPKETKEVLERMKRIPPGENFEFVRNTKWEVKGLMSNVYRRLNPLVPSPTVIAYGGGGTWGYHYRRDRGRLTNRERARLQTFPDSFIFQGNVSEVRAQIGEAVPPLISKRIAEAVLEILNELS